MRPSIVFCLLLMAITSRADRITLVDGITGTGKVVAETETYVLFVKDGAPQRVKIPRIWIRSIERDSVAAPGESPAPGVGDGPAGEYVSFDRRAFAGSAEGPQLRGVQAVALTDGSTEWLRNGLNIELADESGASGGRRQSSPFGAGQWENPYPSGASQMVRGFIALGGGAMLMGVGLLASDHIPLDLSKGGFLNPFWTGLGFVLASGFRISTGVREKRIHVLWDEKHGQ